jgi:hypothetical protein
MSRTLPTRLICTVLVLAGAARAEDDRPMRWVKDKALQQQIHAAIDRGVAFLFSVQRKEGYWSYLDARAPSGGAGRRGGRNLDRFKGGNERRAHMADPANAMDAGLTAVALYAIGASGVKRDDPRVRSALAWVDNHPRLYGDTSPVGTYAASFLVLALTRLDAKGFAPRIRALADTIAASQHRNGMWGYRLEKPGPSAKPGKALGRGGSDGSNTQIAVLALWAAHSLAGWESPDAVWKRIETHYRSTQRRDGGWGYRPGSGTRLDTMTAAGIVSYIYARAALDRTQAALEKARASKAAKRGLKMHQRFMSKPDWRNFYLVYAIERVGTVAGLADLGWYERGARVLVKRQAKKGSWAGRSLGRDLGKSYETALAVLFLSRATFPPRKGAVTPGERPAPVTGAQGKTTHSRAFEVYHALEPEKRTAALRGIGDRGPGMIDHLVDVLERDRRKAARATALELLQALLDRRFLYMNGADAKERAAMAGAIRATWQRLRTTTRWDPQARRYVPS